LATAPESAPSHKFRLWFALGLFGLFVVGAVASTRPGITWDEPGYVTAGYSYCLWFNGLSPDSFTRSAIDARWQINSEHPPAAKLLYGLAGALEGGRGLLAMLTARLWAALMFAALAGLVYGFTAAQFGRLSGVLAALSLVLMPRVFGHGHLAALDVPVALACLAATWAFCRPAVFAATRGGRLRAAAAGVVWGVALLTKLNAAFLPAILIPWAGWVYRKRAVLPCVILIGVGGLTFVAGWPWLWHDTAARIGRYTVNKTERLTDGDRAGGTTNVPVHYFGRTYRERRAPWHYPLVMTLVTVPLGLLVFSGIGIRKALARGRHRGIGALILASASVHLLVFVLPGVPKYDGVRLFMPAFPFLACLAGIGAAQVWTWWGRAGRAAVLGVLTVTAVVLYATHPYELSYYNVLVGGAGGARRLGLETTYWGDTVHPGVIAHVNRYCRGKKVAVWPRYLPMLERFPWMSKEVTWVHDWQAGRPDADYLIVFPRQSYLDAYTTELMRNRTPLRQWTYLGVPQCLLFELTR